MIGWVIIIALVGFYFQLITNSKEDMILSDYGRWLNRMARNSRFWAYIAKPLGLCIVCNTTWIGLLFFFFGFSFSLLVCIALSCAAAGLATLIRVVHIKLLKT